MKAVSELPTVMVTMSEYDLKEVENQKGRLEIGRCWVRRRMVERVRRDLVLATCSGLVRMVTACI